MAPILGIYASQVTGHLFAPSGAYDSIATVTVAAGATASTITFSSIPSTYTHLQIRAICRIVRSGQSQGQLYMSMNGDTTTGNYYTHQLDGDGTAATSFTNNTFGGVYGTVGAANTATSGIMGANIIDILDYSSTAKYKTVRQYNALDANGSGQFRFVSGLWMSNTAVNSLTFSLAYGTAIDQYSHFALYGIKGN